MTAVLRVLEIMVVVIFYQLTVGGMPRDRGMEGNALLYIRWRTLQSRVAFVHRSEYPEALRHISLLLTPLFWVLNVSVTHVAS